MRDASDSLADKEEISNISHPVHFVWVIRFLLTREAYFFSAGLALAILSVFHINGTIVFSFPVVIGTVFVTVAVLSTLQTLATTEWLRNYTFRLKPEGICFSPGEFCVPYGKIKSTTIRQGFIGRIFGIADVVIEINGSLPKWPTAKGMGNLGVIMMPNKALIPGQSLETATQLITVLTRLMQRGK